MQRNPFASSLDILGVCDSKTEDDFVAVEFLDLNDGSTHSGKVEKALLVTFYEESTVKETEKLAIMSFNQNLRRYPVKNSYAEIS